MKKVILPLVVATSLVSMPALADKKVTSEAWNVITSMGSTDSERKQVNGKTIAYFLSKGKAKQFNGINNKTVFTIDKNGFIQVNKKGEFDGQCVSFVKALANFSDQTKSWKPVATKQVKPGNPNKIPLGSVIAVFKDGNYAFHTGIYMGEIAGDMWILDQNWTTNSEGDDGYLTLHSISYGTDVYAKNKRLGNGNKNDAYSYFVVE